MFFVVMQFILGITLVLAAFTPFTFIDVSADSFNVSFNKDSFQTGDTLIISGHIIDFGMPVIAMSVFDPDEKIISANNLELLSDGNFSKTIPLESPFYEIPGKYLVKLDYGQVTEEHIFEIKRNAVEFEPEIVPQEITMPEITNFYTEKDHYSDGDTIKIFGSVSTLDSPTVLIGIHDPFGNPTGFYFGNINNNLEFSTSFLVKDDVNFKAEGIYSIKAHYAETVAQYFFEYSIESPTVTQTTEDTTQTTEDTTIEHVLEKNDEIIISQQENIHEKLETKKETKIVSKETEMNNSEKILEKEEHDNLSVEDIELGKLLNQINLECDSSIFIDTISYYDGMGPALYRLCQFDNSLKFFNESLVGNPDDVEILVNKGSTLGKIGSLSEALVYYDHAIALDPDYLPAKNNKANILANLGNYDDAILLYNEILEAHPNYHTARTNLNIALSLKSEIQETPMVVSISESEIKILSNEKTLSEKIIPIENKNKKQTSFFEELARIFSSLFSFSD